MTIRSAAMARYGVAVVAFGGALFLSLLLRSFLDRTFLFLFLAACVVTVRLGGLGPSVLTIVLSVTAIDYFLLEPVNAFAYEGRDLLFLLVFAVTGLGINWIYASLRSAKLELDGRQAQIERRDQRLRTLLQNMPVMLNIRGAHDPHLTWNKEAERVTGYSSEEIAVSADPLEVLYPDPQQRAEILDYWRTHQGDYRNWEVAVTRKDGEKRIISWSSVAKEHPIPEWSDWAVGVDITERRQVETRLRLLQSIAAALVEATTPEEVAEAVVSHAYTILGVGAGTIYRLLPDGATLELLRQRHLSEETSEKFHRIPLSMEGPITDAIRAREPVFISTIEEYAERYPSFIEYARQNGSVAIAGMPLIIQDTIVGGLSLSFPTPTPMTEAFKALLLAVAQQCAQALHRALLFAEVQQQRERLQVTLTSIGDAVIATDRNGDIVFINPVAQQLTGWTEDLAIGKPLKDVFHIVNEQTRISVESPYEKVIQTGAIVGLANHTVLVARDGRELPVDDSGAPIFDADGTISGVIIVFRDVTERRRDEFRTMALQRVTSLFLRTVTVQEVADVVMNQALPLIGAQRGMLAHLNDTEDGLIILGQYGLSADVLRNASILPLDAKIVSVDALRTGESVWIESAADYRERYPDSPVVNPRDRQVQSAIALPFELEMGIRAVLSVGFAKPQVFDDATRAFITAITRQCAQAMERARLYEVEKAARERITFLAEASALLTESPDYNTTLKHVTRLAVSQLADWCSMDVLDEDGVLRQLKVAHSDEEKEELVARFREQRLKDPVQAAATLELIRQRQTLVFPTVTPEMIRESDADEETKELLLRLNLRAAMYVPLIAHNRPLGLLSLGSAESGRTFKQDDVRLAEELAQRAAIAIENAHLYREAQAQRERLRVTLTSIGDAVIATDVHGSIIFVNSVAEEVTGWHADEAIGKPLNHVFHIVSEETEMAVDSPYHKVMQTGAVVGLANHTLLVRRDGSRVPIDDSGAPIHDESGAISGVIIVFRDITERRKGEVLSAALHRLTAAFSEAATVEQITNLVVTQGVGALNAHMGVIMLLNGEGSALQPLAHYNFAPQLLDQFQAIPLSGENAITHAVRTGTPIWLETLETYIEEYPDIVELRQKGLKAGAVVPLVMQGKVSGVMNIFFREPHVFDEGDRNFIVALAYQCAQAMERARLYEAEQEARLKAEEANQLKMRFLGMISHELRTPLTSIKGFATTLLAEDVTFAADEQHRFLDVIDQEADKLTELIDQLLDLTRLQSNTLTIKPEREKLQSAIDVAAAQLATLTLRHRLRLDIPADLPQVQMDVRRIAQVLVNLVGNAAKFSPHQTDIVIQARNDGESVVVQVCDQGPGIPPDAHDYVFEAFRQIENAGVQRKGAGLGLAISRALIEGHGGQIWIETDHRPGTVIAFTLPVSVPEDLQEE